ncbi:threonine/serine dehydratase [Maricaulaceae bacterium NA33B04]|nr:threonine/serine dehydratase [Maricaulaceae bacterium NA33B04]
MTHALPVFDDVAAAAERIRSHAVRTPLLSNAVLDERVGGRVLIKPECLQRTGSFKFRGAFNALSQFDAEQRKAGVVAFSSGNHAQGIAEAARLLDMPATIVMPRDAPEVKRRGVISRGAGLKLYDRETESREEISNAIAAETGATVIPSYDHPHIMAGQGTCGLEVFEDLAEMGVEADQLACCLGGGGLISGIGLAAGELSPGTRLYGVEPEGFEDHKLSLQAGHRVESPRKSGSICDALLTPMPGVLTFALNEKQLTDVAVVTDDEAMVAVRFVFETLKLVVEPGGAVALASLLSGKLDGRDRTSVIVLTGGNIDPAVMSQAIRA